MRVLWSILPVVAVILTVHAWELPAGMSILPDGTLDFGGAKLTVSMADATWRFCGNRDWTGRQTAEGPDFRRISGCVALGGVSGTVSETLRRLGPDRWRFESSVEFPAAVTCNAVSATFAMPLPVAGLAVDGRKIAVPEISGNQVLFAEAPAKSVTAELPGGVRLEFTGDLRVYVQDNRRWGNDIGIRFYFSTPCGSIRRAEVRFDLKVSRPETVPVSLAAAANRTFADRDGSGWTGQGAKNDFAGFKPGDYEFSGIPFQVCGEKGAVVVGRSAPREITLGLPGRDAGAVNLLHASAFTPEPGRILGFLDVTYADGKRESVPVKAGIDCDNWHLTISRPNAVIAVQLENGTTTVGLYASSFPLSGRKPVSLTFRIADPKVFWMVTGVTLSDRLIRFSTPRETPLRMQADAAWRPYCFERRIVAGSPLDFSGGLDAPAGKYGFVRPSEDGHFTFENAPDKRIRFYGVNLCKSANFPDRKTADELVDYLAKMGYNAVRFHHHDNGLVAPDSADSTVFDAGQLDRLDYLFAKLKERGLYVTTDLYTSRTFRAGDTLADGESRGKALMKSLLAIDRGAMENWKNFARKWMGHRNPYTGLTWGEDPALVCLNLVNEEPLADVWAATPRTAAVYREKFRQWKQDNAAGEADFPRFLQELQSGVLDEQIGFVKNDLRLKTMITSLNCDFTASLTVLRDKFDLVDNHQYFAHPAFPVKPWSLPHRYDQSSPIGRNAILPRLLMPTRIFGKPFIVTEFNYCNPNVYRAAGGPLLGAYAAFQDWDGIWRFAWSHTDQTLREMRDGAAFDAVNDPMQQFGDRIVHALFLRGDFAPAAERISMTVPKNPFSGSVPLEFPDSFSGLGLNAQVGSHVEGQVLPAGVKPYRPGLGVAADPRLKLDPAAGTFAAAAPLTETVTLPRGTLAADRLRVRDADTFMTVAALSLDRLPLEKSRSILLIHLTNFAAAGTDFGNADKTLLRQWGELPHLVERGTALVELRAGGPWRVAALASDGSEAGVVEGESRDGVFRFPVDTCGFPGGVSAYHLTR